MKNGRFLPFNLDIMSFILSTCVRSIGEDEGGSDESAALDSILGEAPTGDGNPSEEAPASDANAEPEKSEGEESKEQQESSEEQASEVSDDDLTAALQAEESTDAKTERLEREYKASSTEAKRLSSENKAMVKFLEDQGLKVVVKDGMVSTLATDKYSDKVASVSGKISDLSAADQESLESGDLDQIQPVIDKLMKTAEDAYVRAKPTLEKEAVTLSPEKQASVFEHMAKATLVNDAPKHVDFAKNQKHILGMVNDPARNDAIREAFANAPEFMAEVLNNHINTVKAGLRARNAASKSATEKKQSEARNSTNASVEGGSPKEKGSGDDAFFNSMGM